MKKKRELIYFFFLFIFSISVNQYYGNIGVFPIDTFLFYDSGFRTLNGYFPTKDFWINSGFLMMNPSIFSSYKQTCFSLEQDFISNQLDQLKVMGFIQKESLFIDIGLPESYDSAQQLLKKFT